MNINEVFLEQEKYAKENNVPIMMSDGIDFVTSFIRDNNIKEVLEIGTAIGYSALKMANLGTRVTTIERDEIREEKAEYYIKKSEFSDKITLILADALEVNIEGLYDLILIDAAKSQNKKFLEKYKTNLKENGYILIDNIDFHGYVGKSNEIKSRNLRQMVRKIEDFLKYLDEQEEFKVKKIEVGDGLILLERIKKVVKSK